MILLAQAWERRALILTVAVVGLIALCKRQHEAILRRDVLLAEKPKVEERVVTKVVQGPVKIVEKIVEKPGGERVVERTIEREAKTVERDNERVEKPSCPEPHRAKSRYAGPIFGADGFAGSWVKGARGGVNIYESWDLGANIARERDGRVVVGGDVVFRW